MINLSQKVLTKWVGGSILLMLALMVVHGSPLQEEVRRQLWGLNQLYYYQFKDKVKARVLPQLDKRFSFSKKGYFLSKPISSHQSGFYDSPFALELASPYQNNIVYTLNGSIPTPKSLSYTHPIKISETTVVRFRIVGSGFISGEVGNRTFFINETIDMPVLSIIADPVTLWNRYSGIRWNYLKRGRRWEREVFVEFFEKGGNLAVRFPSNLRIHGAWSRRPWYPQKSWRLIYSVDTMIDHSKNQTIFSAQGGEEKAIIVRTGGNNYKGRLRDELVGTMFRKLGGLSSPFVPSILYINGKIWGIYNIREKINEEFLEKWVSFGNYDLLDVGGESKVSISGTRNAWENMIKKISARPVFSDDDIAEVERLVDIQNLTDYWLLNIFVANLDWPGANIKVYRKIDAEDTRWRWLLWDADLSLDFEGKGLRHNTLGWAVRNKVRPDLNWREWVDSESMLKPSLIVSRLLTNEKYKKYFLTRFLDLLNMHFMPVRVEEELNKIIALSAKGLELDWERWGLEGEEYWGEVEVIKNFIRQRPAIVREHLKTEFVLGKEVTVRIDHANPDRGDIQVNTVVPMTYPWLGIYFQKQRVVLRAKPKPGYKFVRWGHPNEGGPELSIELHDDVAVAVEFQPL